MHILSERNVDGMVPYIMATELPPCAVMPFIEGADLQTAIEQRYLKEWHQVLFVARGLAKTLVVAHGLPERVYHRDIRPRNIMLEGIYEDPDDFRVVLLDFDLSWHMGASELSVVETANYYQAPEQLHRGAGTSTRRAAVDSYGLGMTLLYLRTGKHPQYMQHMHKDWGEFLLREVCTKRYSPWLSLPRRYARLIDRCTRNGQEERPLMATIYGELDLLYQLCASELPASVPPEALAEELCCRVASEFGLEREYEVNREEDTFVARTASGLTVSMHGDGSLNEITFTLRVVPTGQVDAGQMKNRLGDSMQWSHLLLSPHGWRPHGQSGISSAQSLTFSMVADMEAVVTDVDATGKRLLDVTKRFRF